MTVTVNGKKVASHSESHGRYDNFRKGIAKKMTSHDDRVVEGYKNLLSKPSPKFPKNNTKPKKYQGEDKYGNHLYK